MWVITPHEPDDLGVVGPFRDLDEAQQALTGGLFDWCGGSIEELTSWETWQDDIEPGVRIK